MRVKALSSCALGPRARRVRAGGPGDHRLHRRQIRRLDDSEQAGVSARSGGRPDGSVWYTRAARQHHRPLRSGDRTVQGVRAADAELRAARPAARRGGETSGTTGNAAGLIGMVDAKTGKVTEYKMPNPKAKDPHTIAFLRDGRIFFTVQAGNFIGTLDPKAPGGNIKLIEAPTLNSRPYGVRLDSKGTPFFDEFNSNKIGSMDPKTMVVREYPLPNKGRPAAPHRHRQGRHGVVTATTRAATSVISIRRAARWRSSRPPAAASRCPTRST